MRLPAFLRNRRTRKKIIIALIIIVIIIGIRVFGAGRYINFEEIRRNRESLRALVSKRYFLFVTGYMLTYLLTAAFAVPLVSEPLTLAGGLMFGALPGAIYTNIGATAGASMAFLFSRYLLGGWIQQRFQFRLVSLNREIERNGYRYLLSLRLTPLVSFTLVDLLAGITRIPLKTFIWTTSAGILPASLIYSYAGSRLRYIDSAMDIFSQRMLIALALLALLPVLPVIYRKVTGRTKPIT